MIRTTLICSCRRSLRGNVDRNTIRIQHLDLGLLVVPYVGTWIEIFQALKDLFLTFVVPYVGTWIEIIVCVDRITCPLGRSLRGNVDRNCILIKLLLLFYVVPYVGTWIEIQ